MCVYCRRPRLPVIVRWLEGSAARQANRILGRRGQAFRQDESFDNLVHDEAELDRPLAARGGWQAKARTVTKSRNSSSRLSSPARAQFLPPETSSAASSTQAYFEYDGP